MKKTDKNNELKSVKVNVATNFIKDEMKIFSDADVYTDDDDSEEDRLLDLEKMYVARNKISAMSNGDFSNTRNSLEKIFFLA